MAFVNKGGIWGKWTIFRRNSDRGHHAARIRTLAIFTEDGRATYKPLKSHLKPAGGTVGPLCKGIISGVVALTPTYYTSSESSE